MVQNGEKLLRKVSQLPRNCVLRIVGSDLCDPSETSSSPLKLEDPKATLRNAIFLDIFPQHSLHLFQKISPIKLTIKKYEFWTI